MKGVDRSQFRTQLRGNKYNRPPISGTRPQPTKEEHYDYAENIADRVRRDVQRMSQTDAIAAHLRSGDRLSPLEALNKYGCFRLAARIHDLRRQGMDIRVDHVTTAAGKTIAEYYLQVWDSAGQGRLI